MPLLNAAPNSRSPFTTAQRSCPPTRPRRAAVASPRSGGGGLPPRMGVRACPSPSSSAAPGRGWGRPDPSSRPRHGPPKQLRHPQQLELRRVQWRAASSPRLSGAPSFLPSLSALGRGARSLTAAESEPPPIPLASISIRRRRSRFRPAAWRIPGPSSGGTAASLRGPSGRRGLCGAGRRLFYSLQPGSVVVGRATAILQPLVGIPGGGSGAAGGESAAVFGGGAPLPQPRAAAGAWG
ncbi:hypothetical protein PVAP13_9NG397700 [Panicum virgatum]|uniref:Uncharacterized protein n=1 Tax=Panicum virgatum TaxID=38727 RepID=A0A8T0MRN8_PANVG|nr:hypothetical protein PVAP13_9NG397700 [Panicum virgatum]